MKRCIIILFILIGGISASAQSMFIETEHHPLPPKVPKMIVFAGDTITFERADIYERMDRELIAFTYSHTNSILMLKRSEKIFSLIEPILKEYGVPEDLKYLMAIESNLDPKALSTAGAAGLWQFMKVAAREKGLIVDDEVDERYNIEKETVAACKYIKGSYSKFGSWMSVCASYNGGIGGLQTKLEKQMQKNAMDLWMVEETSRYMYRVLVAKMFFEHPEDFGFQISKMNLYPPMKVRTKVTVSESIPDLAAFAIENGTTYKHLKEANLWLRSDKLVNKAGRTYSIIIPEI